MRYLFEILTLYVCIVISESLYAVNKKEMRVALVDRRGAHGRGAKHRERERCRAAGSGPRGPAHRRGPRVAVEEAQGVLQNHVYAHVHCSVPREP